MTNAEKFPEFYNDLDLSLAKAWAVIEAGLKKRTSAAHTPAVGTIGAHGYPELRIMVLREADQQSGRLRFHTDARSNKIGGIGAGCPATVLFYDSDEKAQIRMSGTLRVETDGDAVDNAWRQSTPFARRCYMADAAPGSLSTDATSGLPSWIQGKQPEEAELIEARENFAILWFKAQSLEWLYLANAGHRRARWNCDNDTGLWSGNWLVP
jgi:pyridoxamine 5'-phosphate oxidase